MWPFKSTNVSHHHASRIVVTLEGEPVKVTLEADPTLKRLDVVVEERARRHRVKAVTRGGVLVVEYDDMTHSRRGAITVRNTGPAITTMGGVANSGVMLGGALADPTNLTYNRAVGTESRLLCCTPGFTSAVTVRVSPGQLYAMA